MSGPHRRSGGWLMAVSIVLAGVSNVRAVPIPVVLEWRMQSPTVNVNEVVNITLFVRSTSPELGEGFISGDIGFGWDETQLQFLGINNAGTPGVDRSELLFPDLACNANEALPPADGNGVYLLSASFGQTIVATPAGLPLTTFQFRGLATTPATRVEILIRSGFCFTRLFDDEIPNYNILSTTGYGFIDLEVVNVECIPVTFGRQPSSIVVCDGSRLALDVLPNGTPPFTFQWRKDGVSIPGATQSEYVVPSSGGEDTGIYDVIATNLCGVLTSDSASILVWPGGSGDVNGDGRLDGGDIGAFIGVAIGSPNGPPELAYCAADITRDAIVDLEDASSLIARLTSN